jgi:predicted GNAT family acetyltransferase
MDVTLKDNHEESRYEIIVDGVVAGFEVYEVGEGEISLVHTEVDPAFAGQGLAARLVEFALHDARSRGLAVLPYCPYVAKFIREHPGDYLDLVPESEREQFDL